MLPGLHLYYYASSMILLLLCLFAGPFDSIVLRHLAVSDSCRLSAFKKKAPRAIKEVRKFVSKLMLTEDVRIDTGLNKWIWNRGTYFF
jgi:hypothetical protein